MTGLTLIRLTLPIFSYSVGKLVCEKSVSLPSSQQSSSVISILSYEHVIPCSCASSRSLQPGVSDDLGLLRELAGDLKK